MGRSLCGPAEETHSTFRSTFYSSSPMSVGVKRFKPDAFSAAQMKRPHERVFRAARESDRHFQQEPAGALRLVRNKQALSGAR